MPEKSVTVRAWRPVQIGAMRRRTIRVALLSAASLGALGFNPACAQTWQGTTPDWGTAANWSTGAVPTAAGTVNIGSAGTVDPTIS